MKQTISLFLFFLLLINCATIEKQTVPKKIRPYPEGYKKIYPNSNNFTYYHDEAKLQGYMSSDSYRQALNGLYFSFSINDKNEIFHSFDSKYCNQDRIYFNKVILIGKKQNINIDVSGDLFTKEYNGVPCEMELTKGYINNNLNNIYNFYKTNPNIKIKFIGRDGKSYIVPVSEQHRKDLIELVDYYRAMFHGKKIKYQE